MVLDVELLQRGHEREVLWVLEQLPALTVSADVSKVLLAQGYWASYNVPYFPGACEPHDSDPARFATCFRGIQCSLCGPVRQPWLGGPGWRVQADSDWAGTRMHRQLLPALHRSSP